MDCFYNAVPIVRKTRLHFHEFMREVHRELAELQGTVNPLDELGARMARRYRLICFDEFHVADITDAMILHRLLEALFDNGVGFVDHVQFQAGRPLPERPAPRPHPAGDRAAQRAGSRSSTSTTASTTGAAPWSRSSSITRRWAPRPTPQMNDAFTRLAASHDENPVLHIEAREIRARRKAGGVVWFDFKTLCGGPRSQNDYLEIATQFHTVLLSDVPYMPVRMASEARRFTWLVDVLYDRRVKLIMSAQVPPEALYTEGPLAHEFPRTVSRLNEMQSADFLALEHRMVDTRLT